MTSQVDQVLSVLEDTASLLKKIQTNLKKCPKERLSKPGYLQTRIHTIEEYWNTFKKAHQDLLKCTTREQRGLISYFVNDEFFLQEDLYLCMIGDLKDLLASQTNSIADRSVCSNISCEGSTRVKLPNIKLPIFTGNYEEWPTYKDLFKSLIHECSKLSEVEKLHYLKTTLAGEAASLLKHIQVIGANYMQAWETLNHRYNNKRLIVNALLKRLFGMKKCTTQSAAQLKILLDTASEIINSLNNLKVATDSWDPVIIFLVVQKLDPESHKEWEQAAYSVNSEKLSTWKELREFLEATYRTLELVNPTTSAKPAKERVFHVSTSESQQRKECALCKDVHTLCHCNQFNKMTLNDRRAHVKTNKLCFNCLAAGHSVFKCRMPVSCRICKRRHHTLLHQPKDINESVYEVDVHQPTSSQADVEEEKVHHAMVASHHISGQKIALLATAVVIIKGEQGNTTILKALIDSGSQACFISEKATQILKLNKSPVNIIVSGMESMKVKVKHEVEFQLLSRWEENFNLPIKAYVMSKHLIANVHTSTVMKTDWPHVSSIQQLADENYYASGTIDLLLGVNEYAAILKEGLIKGSPGTPCAQNTYLGWILMGGTVMKCSKEDKTIKVLNQEVNVEELLKTIWEIDLDSKRIPTLKEQKCEDIYKQTHSRNKQGKYIVKLPFNTQHPKSSEGNTREIAKRRFEQLERRFSKNKELQQEYTKVIEEYIELKHMEQVPVEEIRNKSVYLPHHAVIRSDKETTKTRVVFDASCKGTNGISLNDELLLGPVLQDDLRSLIIRWRTHAICFVSDIQKMYRMIWVDKTDADYQRILWRNNPTEDIKDYRLLTVTFGTASAPYLAVRTLMQLADDEGHKYPEAARILREDFYVDDVMSGCDNLEDAVRISQDLKRLLQLGGFELKKWSSNSRDLMETIDPSERSSNAHLKLNIDGIVKALGIQWNLGKDQFEYKLNLPVVSTVITKRSILSDIQKLFDPLGWLAPSLVRAKILIQQLWLERIDWDATLNETLAERWIVIRSDLENVNGIFINRWMGTSNSNKDSIEIHGFSDASVQAYGAVIYCRVVNPDGTIKTTIIASRTRVAPLKTISLPRLELCGSLLLSRLLKQIERAMRIPTSQIFAWTDSSIVISWLFGDPNKWKPFVANRVVEITSNVNCKQWHHVLSGDNPADIASRGMSIANLKKCDLWWNGPQWLLQPKIQFTRPNIIPTDLETKKNTTQVLKITKNEDDGRKLYTQFDYFDTLIELLRTITYCRRFLKQKESNYIIDKLITTEELQLSLQICIKIAQEEEFEEEINRLKERKTVKKASKIKFVDPYLDRAGVLRVGGRLRNSDLDDESKHPIILGRNSKLSILIVAEAHTKTLHGGIQLMLSYLRSKYWILRAKALVKLHVHRCLVCAKLKAKARTQIMGDLPSARVKPARPFLSSGVDFAGPFQILTTKGRGSKTSKTYIAIFICMSTKAVHLELVGDLSTAAFIGAFKRFCSRRGKCTHLYSDQGRNFIGANKELYEAWKEAGLQFGAEIAEMLANDGTQWHFIPAYSPTFGGLWEAGVKSTKFHLKRILTTNLTFEEMTTVLCEIEACLNSRPLCPMDDDNMQPLTPGHFLITESPIIVPDHNIKDAKISNLTRWQYTRKLLNDFWTRWQKEYLTRLQQRPKWLKREEEFKVGDIVLIKQDNLPPGKWYMGRITGKHPGPDGLTRVYSVKSGDSITKRCVTKLCALPIDSTDTD